MTIYDLKPAFQNLLRPMVKIIHKMGISPNALTIITCIASIIYSYFLYQNITSNLFLITVPFFFFIRMAFNAMDGILAKEYNLTSKSGALLNELTDVISDLFLYLAFIGHPMIEAHFIYAIIILAIITEFIGVCSVQIGASRRYDGPMGKSDRAFVFSAFALSLALYPVAISMYEKAAYVVCFLLILTVINRFKKALREEIPQGS